MGVGIGHHGGPVTEVVVDATIRYLEDGFKRRGLKETDDWQRDWSENVYWKVDRSASEFERKMVKDSIIWDENHPYESKMADLRRNLESAAPEERSWIEEQIRCAQWEQARTHLRLPHDFQPTRQKGIMANLDPDAESFGVVFTQNGTKDEWRDLGGYTKTNFVKLGPGVHIGICEFLEEIQRRVKAAGGDYQIGDECDYCDDWKGHSHDPRKVLEAMEESNAAIDKVQRMLREGGQDP